MRRYSVYRFLEVVIIIIILIGFFQADYLKTFSAGELVLKIFKAIGPFLALGLFLLKSRRLTLITILWIAFELWLFIATIVHGSDLTDFLEDAIGLIGMGLLFDSYRNNKVFLEKLIFYFLSVLIIINFLTIILFPHGLYSTGLIGETTQNWFLGFKNTQVIYLLPFIALSEMMLKRRDRVIYVYGIYFLALISAVLIQSGTTLVGIITFEVICHIVANRKLSHLLSTRVYFWISLLLFISIPILRLQEIFSFVIVKWLHKSVNLTGRTYIWDQTLLYVRHHPLLGWGYQTPTFRNMMYNANSLVSAHNQMLEYLFEGGAVLLCLYVYILYKIARRIDAVQGVNWGICSALFIATQVLLITEVHVEIAFYIVYFIMWHFCRINEVHRNDALEEANIVQI